MRIAFCLFKYSPYGGLERDFLRSVKLVCAHGHDVSIYTMSWEGDKPSECQVNLVPVTAWTNHGRAKQFANRCLKILEREKFDVVVGFNRMPGLDIYFQADPCFRAKHESSFLSRYLPRFKTYAQLEAAVYSPRSQTQILLINHHEKNQFMKYYQTPASRFHDVPPGIDPVRKRSADQTSIREAFRTEMGIRTDQFVLLMVGSDFKRKGVDRTLSAIAALPHAIRSRTILWVVGRGNPAAMMKSSKKLGISENIRFWGASEEVTKFYAASDVLLHPAYEENTGTVLIEAIEHGLPIIVSGVCGYASVVKEANAGVVLAEPFAQSDFNQALFTFLNQENIASYRHHALEYSALHPPFYLTEFIVEVIENAIKK